MTHATIADVAVELGRATPSSGSVEAGQWQGWLERVERAIVRGFARAGLSLAEEITAGRVSVDDVADVEVIRVAARVSIGVATGLTSTTVTVDDGSVTNRREGGESYDPLALTEADWATLLPGRRVRGGVFSVMPS